MRSLYFTNCNFLIYTVRNSKDSDEDRNDTNRIFTYLSYLNDTCMDAGPLECTRTGVPKTNIRKAENLNSDSFALKKAMPSQNNILPEKTGLITLIVNQNKNFCVLCWFGLG